MVKVSTLLMICMLVLGTNTLYLGETFLYKNVSTTMPASFNITLQHVATIPKSLRSNSMCQVPDFQLSHFNDKTAYQYMELRADSGFECDTVGYCDDGGFAGISDFCVFGDQYYLVDDSCISNLWTAAQQEILQATDYVLGASKNFTETAINAALQGINVTLQQELQGISDMLVSTVTNQEASLLQAIVDSAAAVTNASNANLDELASKTTNVISNLQNNVNRQFGSLAAQVQNLGSTNYASMQGINRNILQTNIQLSQRVANLTEYVNQAIGHININNFMIYENLLSAMSGIQQLTVKVAALNTFTFEGKDISPLLSRWKTLNQSTIFQDPSTNMYNFVANSVLGVYPQITDGSYPDEGDAVNRTVYQCYYDVVQPKLIPQAYQQPYVTIKMTYSAGSGAGLTMYDYIVTQLGAYCNAATMAFLDNTLAIPLTSFEFYSSAGVMGANMITGTATLTISVNINTPSCISSSNAGAFLIPNTSMTPVYTTGSSSLPLYIVDESTSVLGNVTSDNRTYTYYYDSARSQLQKVILTSSTPSLTLFNATYDPPTYIVDVVNGFNHFYVKHPNLGVKKLTKCVIAASVTLIDSNPIGTTNAQGQLIAGSTSSVATVDSYGLSGKQSVQLLRSYSNDTSNNAYYYTPDIWCCDKSLLPVLTVFNSSDCSTLGYAKCATVNFGNCSIGSVVQTRILTAGNKCPVSYTPTPLSIRAMYKSPRVYYCDGTRKYREPYGVELSDCLVQSAVLPGAGVLIETGIMAPGGLYPADCIFWNSVDGAVPMYVIKGSFEDMIVPNKITDLLEHKIVYSFVDTVIDEMANLYGVGNSGYDCVNYEMDKILHYPHNCINFDIPEYDLVSYFAGRVVTTGLSSLNSYFVISPISNNASGDLTMNFALRPGVDYEAAIVDNINNCPAIRIGYKSNTTCVVSGWDTSNRFTTTYVNGNSVCPGSSCISSYDVPSGTSIVISVKDANGMTQCNTFKCLASTHSYSAYTVDTFGMYVQRPNQGLYLNAAAQGSYSQALNNLISTLNTQLPTIIQASSYGNVSTNVTIKLQYPDLNSTIANIVVATNLTIANIQNQTKILQDQISGNINATVTDIAYKLNVVYNESLVELLAVVDRYENITFMPGGGKGYANVFHQVAEATYWGTIILGIETVIMLIWLSVICVKYINKAYKQRAYKIVLNNNTDKEVELTSLKGASVSTGF